MVSNLHMDDALDAADADGLLALVLVVDVGEFDDRLFRVNKQHSFGLVGLVEEEVEEQRHSLAVHTTWSRGDAAAASAAVSGSGTHGVSLGELPECFCSFEVRGIRLTPDLSSMPNIMASSSEELYCEGDDERARCDDEQASVALQLLTGVRLSGGGEGEQLKLLATLLVVVIFGVALVVDCTS